jgi:3,4-dihydroxy 2-butanone 4-phosphate synthase/GTP cyclohydrolase II
VRVHSHCLAGDVFGSSVCECHSVLERSMQAIAEAGEGAIIYLHQTSRGFDVERLGNSGRLHFHRERDASGPDGQRKTQRQVGLGAQILSDLKLNKIRLLTNHPRRVAALEGFGIEIVEQIPLAEARSTAG